jgi:phosphoribosyl 1,2-cyclic phosphodiesterase
MVLPWKCNKIDFFMTTSGHASGLPFHLRFWGVRGSIPTASQGTVEVGGNTTCVQIVCGGKTLDSNEVHIIDAGSGIRGLGKEIASRETPPPAIHIFFSHFHWDHVQGLPFFLPLYSPQSNIIFHSAHPPERLREVLAGQMQGPYFPVCFDQIRAKLDFRQVGTEPEQAGPVEIEAFQLHHPQGCTGFRMKHAGWTGIYATDHEHGEAVRDRELLDIAEGADIMIYDSQYTPKEYESRRGWGHSTWLEGTRLAERAGVKQLALIHHDPDHDDAAIRAIEKEASEVFPGTRAACEGMML